ncbi:hypothetical protein [Flammeovirga sp. SJP92]|uniref:hypothetical protein n=1 Tax=Flammeovirga sp. SJP92 TaxID=1775430 RepID=UPI0007891D85|nr:hypothetical protein [Flammeovirga sp. SJP92]KXX67119.1 hypothetical protein AVL50_27410 [Flammeovirga sp. SJP92]
MKNYYLSLLLLLISTSIYAQVAENKNLLDYASSTVKDVSLLHEENFDGTPFYNEGWNLGTVTTTDNTDFNNVLLRFNTNNDQLWHMKNAEHMIVVDKQKVLFFEWKVDNVVTQFERCSINGEQLYLEVIYLDENFQIYKKRDKILIKKGKNDNGNSQKDQYIWSEFKLYQRKEGQLVGISSKEKQFFLIFGKLKGKIHKFAKSNKLKINKKEDLEEIFAHYYTLVH